MMPNSSGFPLKRFSLTPHGGIVLDDPEENSRFLSERIELLKNVTSDRATLQRTIVQLFAEFVRIYEFDKKTAVLPEPYGSFQNEKERQKWLAEHLLATEFCYHLGCILANYHIWLLEYGLPDVILSRYITDYPGLYDKALYDYCAVLKDVDAAYPFELVFDGDDENREALMKRMQDETTVIRKPFLASFAMPVLIERFLIDFMQQDLIDEKMCLLYRAHQEGTVFPNDVEMDTVRSFAEEQIAFCESKEVTLTRCIRILKKYGYIKNEDGSAEIVLGRSARGVMTLGMFLKNRYARAHLLPEYLQIMEMLFSNDGLNLRNAIMHGESIQYDPYTINFVSVMFQLFWGIMDRGIFA